MYEKCPNFRAKNGLNDSIYAFKIQTFLCLIYLKFRAKNGRNEIFGKQSADTGNVNVNKQLTLVT